MATVDGTKVTLTWPELMYAGSVGCKRMVRALQDGRRDKYGADRRYDGWTYHIEGCCGELALCAWLNVNWPASIDAYHGPDVYYNDLWVEARTRSNPTWELPYRDDRDADTTVLCLVTGRSPDYEIVGFLPGALCKKHAVLKTLDPYRPQALCVEQKHLIKPAIWRFNVDGANLIMAG